MRRSRMVYRYDNKLKIQMKKDLMAAYREVAPSCWTQRQAWLLAVRHPAPRFYVTPETCYYRLRKMFNGDWKDYSRLTPLRKKMYDELYDLALELSKRKEYAGKDLMWLCGVLVTMPASQFFVGCRSIERTFSNIRLRGYYNFEAKDFKEGGRLHGKKKDEYIGEVKSVTLKSPCHCTYPSEVELRNMRVR